MRFELTIYARSTIWCHEPLGYTPKKLARQTGLEPAISKRHLIDSEVTFQFASAVFKNGPEGEIRTLKAQGTSV